MKKADFTHLHVHSSYSIGESVLKIDELILSCKKHDFFHIALTDINNLYGSVEFYFKAIDNGLKPVLGAEITFENGNLLLLCKNNKGFENLIYLINLKNSEKSVCFEDLIENSEGLIVLSGSENSKMLELLDNDDFEGLEEWIFLLHEKFKDDFYIEISNDFSNKNHAYMHLLEGMAENLGVNTVLTNNIQYQKPSHYKILDAMNCILSGTDYYDTERKRIESNQNYVKSADEMKALGFDNAYKNANEIARKCNVFLKKEIHLPKYKVPEGFKSSEEYLLYLTSKNIDKKYSAENKISATERLNKELAVINKLNYSDYFLIVWDIIHYAKEHNITIGPGRGSSVSSIVAYLLDIIEVDPLEFDLIFERFLNEEREDFPDIDIDVCSEKRERLLSYVRNKFGKKNVANIISFGTFKTALAIREIGKVLGIKDGIVENIMSNINRNLSIRKNVDKNSDLKKFLERSKEARKVIIGAERLEGIIRNISLHAAGIVIYPEKLDRNLPVIAEEEKTISQWDKNSLERLGVLKIDLLSLRTLSMIDNILKRIRKKTLEIDYKNENVYKSLAAGRTSGVFQFETANMTRYIKLLKPECFDDLCLLTSVARPGARDNFNFIIENKENTKTKYKNKLLKNILKSTYGVIVYQEQIMEIAVKLAGFSYMQADSFRKAISSKNYTLMKSIKESFLLGTKKNKIDVELANEVFDDIVKFAGYGFNKSHAVAYSAISYKCAYLKNQYPVAFYTEELNSNIDKIDKIEGIIREMREEGVKILLPHLLKSKVRFSGGTKGIRYAFAGIRGIGFTQGRILEDFIKQCNKKIASFDEFIFKAKNFKIHENVIKALIFSGACDFFKLTRKYMIENIGEELNYNSLFGDQTEKNMINKEYDDIYLREKEKEYLGFTFTHSIIDDYIISIKLLSQESISDAKLIKEKDIRISGVVCDIDEDFVNGVKRTIISVEDNTGKIKLYSDLIENIQIKKNDVAVFYIKGVREGYVLSKYLHIEHLFRIPELKLALKIEKIENIEVLKDIFEIYQGEHEIHLIVASESGDIKVETAHMIQINEILLEEIEEIVGLENMALRFE